MTIRITFRQKQVGPKSRIRTAGRFVRVAEATMQEAAREIERRGRANISRAGNFGTRWTEGLKAEIGRGVGASLGRSVIRVTHDVPYFIVFEEGRVIRGRPLLWIPLSFASEARGVRARDYPGGLFRVERKGKAPLLLSRLDKEPKYFGKEQVTIPKKFRIREIILDVSRKIREIYARNYRRLHG